MDDDDLPSPASTTGTSMLMSGGMSLPGLHDEESVASSLDIPPTPTTIEDLPQAPPLPPRSPTLPPMGRLRQLPAILECPFDFLACHDRFRANEFTEWLNHSLNHFGPDGVPPPRDNRCVFCGATFSSESGTDPASWNDKLVCAWHHHTRQGFQLRDASFPDYALHRYLWEKGILEPGEWKRLQKLRVDMLRRGGTGPASGLVSPPGSPDSEESLQERLVMTSHIPRNRPQERSRRREMQLVMQGGDQSDTDDEENQRTMNTGLRQLSLRDEREDVTIAYSGPSRRRQERETRGVTHRR